MNVMITQVAKRFAADTAGGAAVIVAVSLPAILGFAALGIEYGSAIVTKSQNQRTSDIAAFAAAFAYNKNGSVDAAKSVAESVAALNGVVSVVSVNFDNAANASYVDVVISEEKPIYLSRMLRPNDSVTIHTTSRVSMGDSGFTPCILSLGEFTHDSFTLNGKAGTYTATGCGIAANAAFEANGVNVDTDCVAPSFNKADACTNQTIKGGFSDPLANVTNWPNDPADNAVCDHTGSLLGNLSDDLGGGEYQLLPGVLCVDDISGSFDAVFSNPAQGGNTLIVKAGVHLDISGGKKSFSVRPSTSGTFEGVAIYAPKSDITTSGNASFSIDGLSCLGLVVNSMTFNGTVTLNAECDADDIHFNAFGSGQPRLIR